MKLYCIMYMSEMEDRPNCYMTKDSWMVESKLDELEMFNLLEDWNNKLIQQGISGRFAVDLKKDPVPFEELTFESLLDKIKNL